MSVVPAEIPEVGATSQRLRQNPAFDPLKAGFGTEEYFVWSRFDGATSVKDLILMTGLAVERAVAIVRQLRRSGAILAPGETSPPVSPAASRATMPMPIAGAATATARQSTVKMPVIVAPPVPTAAVPTRAMAEGTAPARVLGAVPLPSLDHPTDVERQAMAEPGDLNLDERARVLVGLRLVAAGEPWDLVGAPAGADKRTIKRAFFERSKLFHPDRFFGRDLRQWGDRLHTVFEAISDAHAALIDGRRAASAAAGPDAAASAPQSPVEYAAELFDRACHAEVSGDLVGAGKLFAAATKLDPSVRYLRRAASCALAAAEPRTALDYAKKASALEPSDPSTARILARALRALDRLDDAEEVLLMALAMKNENDTLASELASDLSAVRATLSQR